jgi:hypothetical protein
VVKGIDELNNGVFSFDATCHGFSVPAGRCCHGLSTLHTEYESNEVLVSLHLCFLSIFPQ